MNRLDGAGSSFLLMETPTQPSTILYVAELRPGTGPDGRVQPLTPADLRAHVERRLDFLPSFRRRIARVPFGLHHPVWFDDPDFDLDYHLGHITLEAPGGRAELDAELSRIAERLHDRRHPLWRIFLVDGLADDRQALILWWHHSMFDGGAAITTLTRLLSEDATAGVEPTPWQPQHPRGWRLVLDALRDQGRQLWHIGPLLRRTLRNVSAVKARRKVAPVKAPLPVVDTPDCSINHAFSTRRRYVRTSVPLADVRSVKDAAGVTLNDVVLTIASTALRGYLSERGELPDEPLTVNIPVSSDPPGAPARQWGNAFTNFISSLATDVPDPWERMRVIGEVTKEGKEQLNLLGLTTYADWLRLAPPFLLGPVIREWARIRRKKGTYEFSVLISNVRGPTVPWSFGSVTVENLYLEGPTAEGAGVNITVFSYGDRLNIVILVDPEALAEPEELASRMVDALAELATPAR